MKFRFWGAVAKDGSHVRDVRKASSVEDAEFVLFDGWTDGLKALYDARPVTISVDDKAESTRQSPAQTVSSALMADIGAQLRALNESLATRDTNQGQHLGIGLSYTLAVNLLPMVAFLEQAGAPPEPAALQDFDQLMTLIEKSTEQFGYPFEVASKQLREDLPNLPGFKRSGPQSATAIEKYAYRAMALRNLCQLGGPLCLGRESKD